MFDINIKMLSVLRLDQNFGWQEYPTYTNISQFKKIPNPKIILVNSAKDWYSIDRNDADLIVYWTSEALAIERAENTPIVQLSSKDRIFSSSDSPTNLLNLNFFFNYMIQDVYAKRHYQKLIPKNEIFKNNMSSTLGYSRLHRCYMFLKFKELNLFNSNVSFFSESFNFDIQKDFKNELPGQVDMYSYVNANKDFLPTKKIILDLDWRAIKLKKNLYEFHKDHIFTSTIIPTKSYLECSLLYISETIPHNKEFFVTEKTIKGLLSGRPFIVIGCQHFLKYLRRLGFITWNSVLDESYDDEENLKIRIEKSILSAKEFIDSNILNSSSKLETIQRITNHNKKILFETNWYQQYITPAKNLILNELKI